jgi:hypothetical protein
MTLRAIHAENAYSLGEAEAQHAGNLTPQHCVQYANVRFRTEDPSGPCYVTPALAPRRLNSDFVNGLVASREVVQHIFGNPLWCGISHASSP